MVQKSVNGGPAGLAIIWFAMGTPAAVVRFLSGEDFCAPIPEHGDAVSLSPLQQILQLNHFYLT
jgi:hypothetical protein